MKIQPTLSEVKEIAAEGKYNVLPVSCEMLSDFTTPIETMKILKNVSTTAICWNRHRPMKHRADIHSWTSILKWK